MVDLKIWGYQSDLLRSGFKIGGSRQVGLGLSDTSPEDPTHSLR